MLVTCEWCKEEVDIFPSRAKTFRFCSRACKEQHQSIANAGASSPLWIGGERSKICEGCGITYRKRRRQPMTSFLRQKFCTHACGVEHRDISGPNNPRWLGGHTKRSNKQAKWARQVISRDGATCQRCGAKDVELHAHHIKSFHDHPELRWDISNGETLCYACHWSEHSASDENAVNSGKPLTDRAEGNPEPSLGGNIQEGLTTRGRAYRRWEGSCAHCGNFLSKRLSDVVGKSFIACSYTCASKHNWSLRRQRQ